MALLSEPSIVARSRVLRVPTHQPIGLVDITDAVARLVRETGVWAGQVLVASRHTTAAIRIQENEPLLLEDLRTFLTRLAPPGADYRHNDFGVRTHNMHPDERPNGHAHCLQMLLGSSESLAVLDGSLQLGTWQRLFLVELDGPHTGREVVVQVLGQGAPTTGSPRSSMRTTRLRSELRGMRRASRPAAGVVAAAAATA